MRRGPDRYSLQIDGVKYIDDHITFSSPFEKSSILLKLLRRERPFVEPIFWTFRTVWDTYTEAVRNLAIDQLQFSQWLSFIDECSQYDYTPLSQVKTPAAGVRQETEEEGDDVTQKSFVSRMVKDVSSKMQNFRRASELRAAENGSTGVQQRNFSLIMSKEWM
jgi:hypothetical protein